MSWVLFLPAQASFPIKKKSVYWGLILMAFDHTYTFLYQKSKNFKLTNTEVYITIQLHHNNNWFASTLLLFQTDFSQ